MNAGVRFHWRLCIERVLDAITLLWNREHARIRYNVERVVLRGDCHPMSHRKIIISVDYGKYCDGADQYVFENVTHEMDSVARWLLAIRLEV